MVAAIITVPFLVASGDLIGIQNWISAISLSLLAVGYATHRKEVFFIAGAALAIASFYGYQQGYSKALGWSIFNGMFSALALIDFCEEKYRLHWEK